MQFLKKKIGKIYDYSRSVLASGQGTAGRRLLHDMLTSSEEGVTADQLTELAYISLDAQEYTELFNYLVAKLGEFAYERRAIRRTLKLLTAATHLLKAGRDDFQNDLLQNLDLLKRLQKVDGHYFEAAHPANTKQLEYQLELIKHRAKYIHLLLTDNQLLAKERGSAQNRTEFRQQEQEEATSCGLKILYASGKENECVEDTSMHSLSKSREENLKGECLAKGDSFILQGHAVNAH